MIIRRIEFPTTDPLYPQFIAILKDVYVSRHGLIFDRNFELVPEVNFNIEFWPSYTPIHDLKDMADIVRRELADERRHKLSGDTPYVYAVHYFGLYVFGHFWDSLQPLAKIEQAGPGNGTLLVNRTTAHVNELSRHFELFGYGTSRRHEVKALTHVPELWYASVECYPGRLTVGGRDWLRRGYLGGWPAVDETAAPTALYLSRNDPAGRVPRRVVNHDEVSALLAAEGFRTVDGSESLDEHIRLFCNAARIIGPHGSMFRNILFAGPDCRVLEFCPSRRRDTSQLEIGQTCGLDYRFLEVCGDDQNNIELDLEVIENWLQSEPKDNPSQ